MTRTTEPFSMSVTGTDQARRFTPHDIKVDSAIIECATYPMYFGAGPEVNMEILVGDRLPLGGVNLRYILIKNKTPGSNGVLRITGMVEVGKG